MKSVGLIIQLVLLTNYLVFESYALHRVSDLSHNHNHNQNATNNSSSLLVPKNKGSKKNKNGKSSSAKNHKHRISNRNTKRVQKHTTSRPDGSEDYMSSTNNKIEVINVTAKVGETVILSCAINSSYGSNPGVSNIFQITQRLFIAFHFKGDLDARQVRQRAHFEHESHHIRLSIRRDTACCSAKTSSNSRRT